jgi:hypothetical protein
MANGDSSTSTTDAAAQIALLESELAGARARIVEVERERDALRAASPLMRPRPAQLGSQGSPSMRG